MEIKAIETRYKGYRFRSRLEARWAVFFDALGIKWEYEKEGFKLSTGERYLPDFWLPDDCIWVEVKGEDPGDEYREMLESFRDDIEQAVMLVIGLPTENHVELFCWDVSESAGESVWELDIAAVTEGRIEFLCTYDHRFNDNRTLYTSFFKKDLHASYMPKRTIFPSVIQAANKARAARFEFGESG